VTLIVNDERIEERLIQRELERLRPNYEKVFVDKNPEEREAQLLDWSRENVIENILLKQEAEKRNIQILEGEVKALMARLRKQYESEDEFYKEFGATDGGKVKEIIKSMLRLERLFEDIYGAVPEASEEAILEFYQENKEQFKFPEQVRVAHIVKNINWQTDELAAYTAMKKVHDELKGGAPFELLVERYSDCLENGGDLGYIVRGQMVEEFDDVVFNLGIGEISEVFRTRFGVHITKVYDRKPTFVPPLREVKDEVVSKLKEQMRDRAVEEFVDKLRSKARIEEE